MRRRFVRTDVTFASAFGRFGRFSLSLSEKVSTYMYCSVGFRVCFFLELCVGTGIDEMSRVAFCRQNTWNNLEFSSLQCIIRDREFADGVTVSFGVGQEC